MTSVPPHGLRRGDRPALIVSECQRGVLDPGLAIFPGLASECARRGTVEHARRLTSAFRRWQLPVVHVHVAHDHDFRGFATTNPISAFVRRERRMVAGSAQVEPIPDLAPEPTDLVSIRRTGLTMWPGTDLDMSLRNERVTSVVLCGVSTNIALVAGALGAVDHGYYAIVAEDACAGNTAETHHWSIEHSIGLVATVLDTQEIIDLIAQMHSSAS